MSAKILTNSAIFCVCLILIFAGCAPEAETPTKAGSIAKPVDLKLNLTQGDSVKYKAVTEMVKDFKFVQPSLDKMKEEQTGTWIETIFTQSIDSVDNKQNAVATIKIEAIKFLAKNKGGIQLDFDSSSEKNQGHPLAKLIGKSYKIKISSSGQVSVVDVKDARAVSNDKFVKSFLDDKSIQLRHQIQALPDPEKSKIQTGQNWSKVTTPPPGMLDPTNFEKTYTLSNMEKGKIAHIKMNAVPTSKAAEEKTPKTESGMGIFAKMFDSDNKWDGQLVIDLESGNIQKYNETLISTYVAAEESRVQVEGKGPDTLTMGLTSSSSIEKLD